MSEKLLTLDEARRVRPNSEWPEPDLAVLSGHRVDAPTLPLEVFDGWADFITTAGEAKGAPVDYVACAILAAASALIGNSRRPVADNWDEPATLWFGLVGGPSYSKSPALDVVLDPLKSLESDLARDFEENDLREFEAKKVYAEAQHERWQDEVKKAAKDGKAPPLPPESAATPQAPVRPRLTSMDTTVEAVQDILAGNPRGILCVRDELTSWLGNFDKFGSGGGDRAFWIESFGGRRHISDRRKWNGKPLVVPFLSISMLGGMQPDRLQSTLLAGDDDGLAARFMLVWPEPIRPKRSTTRINKDFITDAFKSLMALEMGRDLRGEPRWKAVPLEESAIQRLWAWHDRHHQELQHASGKFASHLGKYRGLVMRLSCCLEFLWWSITADDVPDTISDAAVFGAIELVEKFFKPHARRCYSDAALPEEERLAATLGKAIHAMRGTRSINAKEIYRPRHGNALPGIRTRADFDKAAGPLIEAQIIRHAQHDGPGRPRGDFEINPHIWENP